MKQTDVLIVLGSANDESYLEGCVTFLKRMNVSYTIKVASAHRSPDRLETLLKEEPQAQVILAFAGHAAHLSGVIAARVTIPVVAVPLPTSDLQGLDSLLSSVQMPGGVPVATMGIGAAGSHNAACFAVQILALKNTTLANQLLDYKKELAKKVEQSSLAVEKKWQ